MENKLRRYATELLSGYISGKRGNNASVEIRDKLRAQLERKEDAGAREDSCEDTRESL